MRFVFTPAAASLTLLVLPALAQQPQTNCKDPQTQADINICAQRDYETADKALNAQYQVTRQAMKKRDADAPSQFKGAEDALVKAQRAWVVYRDAQCSSYGFQARGGTMEPSLVRGCQADLTRRRTDELKSLTGAVGD